MGTGGSFPGGKARPGRDADHSPPSSASMVCSGTAFTLPQFDITGRLSRQSQVCDDKRINNILERESAVERISTCKNLIGLY
jgi:hypothetical protein